MNRWILILGLLISSTLDAQLVSYNKTETLDIGQLNLEWFGDTAFGPSDNNLQLKNAVQLIKTMDLELLSLCEISDSNYWNRLLKLLPNYQGVVSNYSQTQKTALLIKKDKFKLIYSKQILSQYYSDFASGRLPLEICLETTMNNKKDTLFIWVVHLKSNVGTAIQKSDAYNKRLNSSSYLKNYTDQLSKNFKGIIIGDWNDDFDTSIFNNNVSPFKNWLNDTNYLVVTKLLSIKKIGTTASYPDPIDHIVSNYRMKQFWQKDSVYVVNPSKEILGFSANTTDHFPVITRFYWNNSTNSFMKIHKSEIQLFWNGNFWQSNLPENITNHVKVYNEIGMEIFNGNLENFIPPKSKIIVIRIQDLHNLIVKKYFICD